MKIRKTYQRQMSLLPYGRDDMQWDMLPPKIRNDVETLFAQLILSVHNNNKPLNSEAHHVTENN